MVLVRLGKTLYRPVTTDRGLILRKAGADGPRVGDTKVEDGTTLRFNQNHRWEKMENVAPRQLSWVIDDDLGLDDLDLDLDMPAATAYNDHRAFDLNNINPEDQASIDRFGDRAPALLDLMAKLKADFDAGILDYDDEKWDAYPDDLFEPAAVLLRIA